MINIIIPAYNAHETIEKTIASIAVQTISDQIEIILVDDASNNGYEEIIKKFEKLIKIKYIKHKVNLGVGFARQTGLDAVDKPYFGFADSDDFYTDAFAFEKMLNKAKEKNSNIVSSFFWHREPNEKDLIIKKISWTFAKLYKTSFIKNENIKFPPQNEVEDVIFNRIAIMLSSKKEISFIEDPVYLWQYNKNSITRKNNEEFRFCKMTNSLIKGIDHIASYKQIDKNIFNDFCIDLLFITYFNYFDSKNNRLQEKCYEKILEKSKIFYKKYVKNQNIQFTEYFINERSKLVSEGLILKPHQTFREFLKLVEGE